MNGWFILAIASVAVLGLSILAFHLLSEHCERIDEDVLFGVFVSLILIALIGILLGVVIGFCDLTGSKKEFVEMQADKEMILYLEKEIDIAESKQLPTDSAKKELYLLKTKVYEYKQKAEYSIEKYGMFSSYWNVREEIYKFDVGIE